MQERLGAEPSDPEPLSLRHRAIVAGALAREVLRALAVPLRALLYLPFQSRWRRSTRDAVNAARGVRPLEPELDAAARAALADRPLFLSAAEPSGDHHAAELARELRRLAPSARIYGFGGPELAAAGVELRVDTTSRAAMGLSGVLKLLPAILREVGLFARCLERERPALVAFVDAPAYHLVLARLAKRAGIPVFYYVCPQVWGWAPWRIGRIRRAVDRIAAIFPFEPAWFAAHGIDARYVGHPRVEHWGSVAPLARPVPPPRRLALLPGSRGSDIRTQLPAFLALARELVREHPALELCVLQSSARHRETIERLRREHAPELELALRLGDLRETLRDVDLALVKSGTGSFDVALAGVPALVLYRLASRRERWLRRHLLIAPAIAQANLFEPGIVPEFILATARDEERALELARAWLADDGRELAAQRARLAALRQRLDGEASRRAAGWIARLAAERASSA
ncbi:MAG: lipid-A-disaccharide synthase [Planctomycetes bacterium]|nr:lipid-A-disaccharide synthase [Planctomycetota bacterium]